MNSIHSRRIASTCSLRARVTVIIGLLAVRAALRIAQKPWAAPEGSL
jgi:hypothetical protein